jgi:thiamine biosynthesis lipoprotein
MREMTGSPMTADPIGTHTFTHHSMATRFTIRCAHPDKEYARQAAAFAFAFIDQLEHQLSRFTENSDISRINHLSKGQTTRIGYETMQCLELARFLFFETAGAFDISIGKGLDSLDLIEDEFTVRAGRTGVALDLGAIGKGYALDRAAEVLADWEVDRALIDAGSSSVLALEPPAGQTGWPLTLSAPEEGGAVLESMGARQQVLGASGIRKGGHICDPRTGNRVHSRQAAWVSASLGILADISTKPGTESSPAAVADALSTAFMVMSVEDIGQYCERNPGLEAWILAPHLIHYGNLS